MSKDNPIRNLGEQLGRLLANAEAREDLQKSLNVVAQSGFARLDLVTREQFDAQLDKLQAAEAQVAELEKQLAELQQRIDTLEQRAEKSSG